MRKRILVVDDDIMIRSLFEKILSQEMYQVVTATDGMDALEKIQKDTLDLIILDVMLPKLSGTEVCRKIKENEKTQNIPVIMLSALSTKEAKVNGLASGADDYIVKPFDVSEVLIKISKLIKGREKEREVKRKNVELEFEVEQKMEELKITNQKLESVNRKLNKMVLNQDIILSATQELSSFLDTESLINVILMTMVGRFGVERCALMLLDKSADEFVIQASAGINKNQLNNIRLKRKSKLADKLKSSYEPLIFSNLLYDPEMSKSVEGFISNRLLIGCPIIVRRDLIGIVLLGRRYTKEPFSDIDIKAMMALMSSAGIALDNSIRYENMKEETRIRSNLERYLSPNIVEKIIKDPDTLSLGGERRMVTILFADIRDFTSFSESSAPEDVVKILNDVFRELTEIVFAYYGTLDKYIGDGLMAIFGAPIPLDDHADKAVSAAIQMQKNIDFLRHLWNGERKSNLQIGIGISSGEAVAGNVGSLTKLEYTVIGDVVNTAARLEDMAGPNQILISPTTFALLKSEFNIRDVGEYDIKGKSEKLLIYEVLDHLIT